VDIPGCLYSPGTFTALSYLLGVDAGKLECGIVVNNGLKTRGCLGADIYYRISPREPLGHFGMKSEMLSGLGVVQPQE